MLIDGNSVLNRAFYGLPPLTNSKGFHTNAVYGFLTILLRHIGEDSPDVICVAFDLKAKTYRHELYEGYKAGRKGMPDELAEQLPVMKNVLDALGIMRAECPGLEADDIIGIMSANACERGESVVIVTGDRDELQLVNDCITVKLAVTKQTGSADTVFTPEKVREKYTLDPSGLIDLKALMGDASDNIPGVPGVGEKTAEALLRDYKTLDGVYENLDKIKGALRTKLENGRESAYISRKLGEIIRTLPEGMTLPEPSALEQDGKKLSEIFTELEMLSMLDKFNLRKVSDEKPCDEAVVEYDPSLHSGVFGEELFYILNRPETETVMIKASCGLILLPYSALGVLDGKKVVTHDAKPLLRTLMKSGFSVELVFDTILAAYVLNPSKSAYPLDGIYAEITGQAVSDEVTQLFRMDELAVGLKRKLEENESSDLYFNIELPLCTVLAEAEVSGVEIDTGFLRLFGDKTDKELLELTDAIYDMAGETFNINSTKQLGSVLFEKLMLPSQKKTKTGFSTDNDVLEALKDYHPIVGLVITYRQLAKLKSTYVEGLLKAVAEDGRVHTIFTQTVTQTGRISSVEPNLQNIPVRTKLGRELRRAFRAKEGCTLIDADYSQIELRILAHIADDAAMQRIFATDEDIHTHTASEVFGIPENMVTLELRRRAKAINFGIVYGIGDYSLSQDIGVSRKEARRYIDNYLATFPGVKKYTEEIIAYGKANGYVKTLFGRRRYIPELKASNKQIVAFAERVCRNTPIQGTAADLIKLAMVRVSERLKEKKLKSRLILQIHDELIIEAPENEVAEASAILKNEMENAYKFKVPITTDLHCGKTWFDAKD